MTDTTTEGPGTAPGALLVTIPDAARILAVGRSTLYELIGSGELATVHIRRSVRIAVAELEAFVARRHDGNAGSALAPINAGHSVAARTARTTPAGKRSVERSDGTPAQRRAERLF